MGKKNSCTENLRLHHFFEARLSSEIFRATKRGGIQNLNSDVRGRGALQIA